MCATLQRFTNRKYVFTSIQAGIYECQNGRYLPLFRAVALYCLHNLENKIIYKMLPYCLMPKKVHQYLKLSYFISLHHFNPFAMGKNFQIYNPINIYSLLRLKMKAVAHAMSMYRLISSGFEDIIKRLALSGVDSLNSERSKPWTLLRPRTVLLLPLLLLPQLPLLPAQHRQ